MIHFQFLAMPAYRHRLQREHTGQYQDSLSAYHIHNTVALTHDTAQHCGANYRTELVQS
jgi:hypothetical protein